ncbi:hypothetical protein K438DRAFT_1811094 [Mycena galopus ATCC 62051]|nr:hypothetical protein K438DRAFT_1811094 [Mycena galopus ATCC 62051]
MSSLEGSAVLVLQALGGVTCNPPILCALRSQAASQSEGRGSFGRGEQLEEKIAGRKNDDDSESRVHDACATDFATFLVSILRRC